MAGTSPMATVARVSARPPLRSISFAPVAVERSAGPNGTTLLRSQTPLLPFETNLAKVFRAAVETAPARIFLAERRGNAWYELRYEEARRRVDHIAAAFIERGLSAERPVMILSGNAIEHALLMLAGFCAGVPVAPISVAYSLQSQDFGKLKHIHRLLAPGLVYVADTAPFAKALAALDLTASELVAGLNNANLERVTPFAELAAERSTRAVDAAVAAIRPDTVAKFLFTSGSTAFPKGVINTHLMLTANQQQIAQIWPFLAEQPLVLVDWLPWNHTFGANHNFNMVLRNAGTLYIDGGKPVPALIGETVRNLSEISPTVYFNVPAGYGALLPHLEKDETLARSFFAKLRLIFYAGAALPQDMWSRLEAVAARITGERIPMTSSWGTTETSPLSTAAHFLTDRAGVIGVPVPGVELKLVPSGDKQEIRVRGPNVTPGYWKSPDLTAAAFDEDGFYRPGDAVRFLDAADPTQGLLFDGRLAEDFKLQTGTWVNVGALRIGLLAACSPLLQDAVIAGADREHVGVLAWLNPAGCQSVAAGVPPAELARDARVREHLLRAIGQWNADHPGLSTRIARILLLGEPPSIDANEITDKGYINQRLVLERRKAEVERLFAAPPDADIIVV
ncbi:MAG TPA: feruloyl-CoA synthase, partial [Xanthobacteraceae bacterium]|nr:feruloyl-CoA synthase [Xanthobacteraceae bacterium]